MLYKLAIFKTKVLWQETDQWTVQQEHKDHEQEEMKPDVGRSSIAHVPFWPW